MSDLVKTDSIDIVWLQEAEEPTLWYRRFMAYYLPLGPSRNLTRAYLKYLTAECPEIAIQKKASRGYINAAASWSEKAREWHWRMRAEAFDLYTSSENFSYVDKARDILLQGTEAAARALIESLKSPRLAVAAAKEILDRGGLPGTHLVGVGRIEPYTADDLHRAEQDVANWEKQIRGSDTIVDANVSSDS